MEDMKVFLRERLNGYYSVASFVAANTLSSIPFLAIISFTSALPVYWLSGLNKEAGRFFYFVFNLFMALFVTESMMMAMAPLVPHFLVGIAGGAGVLGLDMLVCGFFQPAGQLPRPVFYYPLHFLSFETYAFYGFVKNEFDGTHGWGCPCSAMAGGCPAALGGAACELEGTDILAYWDVPAWNKCTCPGVAAAHRVLGRTGGPSPSNALPACCFCMCVLPACCFCLLNAYAIRFAARRVRVHRGAGRVRHLLPPLLLRRLQVQRKQVALTPPP